MKQSLTMGHKKLYCAADGGKKCFMQSAVFAMNISYFCYMKNSIIKTDLIKASLSIPRGIPSITERSFGSFSLLSHDSIAN